MTAPIFNNRLLRALGPGPSDKLVPMLTKVTLGLRDVIETRGEPVKHVYFPENGVISVVAQAGDKSTEAGLAGNEGMTGAQLLLGDPMSPNGCMVQLAGDGYRMKADDFVSFTRQHQDFREYLLKYLQTFLIQSSQTSLAMRASLEQRLARWLLMIHDRASGPRLELTHEFLGLMLATRRAGVTVPLHELEGKALLKATRGVVTITDRPGLEELAGPYYGIAESEYRRIMQVAAIGHSSEPNKQDIHSNAEAARPDGAA